MAKSKATATTSSTEWRLVHIFGYGETRLEGSSEKTVTTTSLTKAQALIDFMRSNKPADNNSGENFHVITIAKDLFGRYIPKNKDEKHYALKYNQLDLKLVEDLITEIQGLA
jgi:hypothetical protein